MGKRILLASLLCISMAHAELAVEKAYVRGLLPGQSNTAAFMQLHNNGDEPLTLVGASTAMAQRAELHGHRHKNGMMAMYKVEQLTLAPQERAELAPGGYHLMLLGVKPALKEGESIMLEWRLSDGASVSFEVPVRSVLDEHKHHSH